MIADLLRVIVFASVGVTVGLLARWMASAVHGDIHLHQTRGARIGVVLLAGGMSSMCASIAITSVERYGEGITVRLILAVVGSVASAVGLFLLRKVRTDGA